MMTTWKKWVSVVALALGVSWLAWAQQSNTQQVPDAPSTTKSQSNPFPADAPKGPPPSAKPDQTSPVQVNQPPVNTPTPNIKAVPEGGATEGDISGRDQ